MSVPAPGTIIGRYQVEGTIGAGAMGDVVKATDIDLKRTVAIKILSEVHRDNEELEARFVREGRAVAAISHSNVVQVFTTGTYDGRPYIAMEFLTGHDLGSLVAQQGPLSSLRAAKALLDCAHGLRAAAEAGLIHRDVKPANLLMLDTGVVKITDFGLAKPIDPKNEPSLTAMGVVVGTPDYIAPEQARGETIDERVDIYALGGTLYYLLVGTPPFRKGNPTDDKYLKVVARHLQEPAPNPMLVRPEVDGQLARLQLRLMSKKANARPNYPELISELTEIVERLDDGAARTTNPNLHSRHQTGPSAKTPFLGGTGPKTSDLVSVEEEDDEDSAATNVRVPTLPPTGSLITTGNLIVADSLGDQSMIARPRRSKLLVTTTVLSGLVLLVGVGLFLFGPMPSVHSAPAKKSPDAAPIATTVIPDAAPPAPIVPQGMLPLPATKTHPAAYISKSLVTHAEFVALFPNEKTLTRGSKREPKAERPVVGVTFSSAQAYARTQGGRLPSSTELASALELADAGSAGSDTSKILWEWLEGDAPTAGRQGEMRPRKPRGYKNIGFRVVLDR